MAMSPNRDTSPYVGFIPTMPVSDAGCLIDPPVSEPSANTVSSAATAAADPPDDPPGTQFKFHGFLVVFIAEFSVDEPIANSSRFVLPKKIASEFLSFFIRKSRPTPLCALR